MRRAFAILLLVSSVAAAFAGCVTSAPLQSASVTLSQPLFDLNATLPERLDLVVADGTPLDVVVWRPDTDEKVPVIVDIGPYFGNLGGTMMEYTAIDLRMAEYFVPRGYAMARASVRGTGESGGCFDLGGPQEQQDVHDIIEFLGEQPWSNGNVAAFGKSYDGTTPWMAAITQPSHLKTIVPISGITDWYRYMFYDGTIYPEEVGFNSYYYLLVDDDVDVFAAAGGGNPLHNQDPQHVATKNLLRTCDGFAPQTIGQTESVVTGDHGTAFWQERDYEPLLDKVQVPVFMVHGLQDWNVKMDNQVPLYDALDVPKAGWFGQWGHDYPDINRFNAEWSRHDWNETLLVWFDHWLKGVENDWQRVAHVEAQDQLGTWRTYETWPPADAEEITLWPTADGALAAGAPDAASLTYGTAPIAAESLVFETGPMPSNVTLLGRGFADLHLSIDRPGGNVGVTLYVVEADGTATEVDHGMRELRHRESRETGSPVTPGEAFNTTVWLYPQEITIPAGAALRLVVSAELPAWIEPSPFVGATTTLSMGEGASSLHLFAQPASAEALHAAAESDASHEHDPAGLLAIPSRATVK